MKGGARARAGRPAHPVEVHRQRGTFRFDRHGTAAGQDTIPTTPAEWQPTSADLARLGATGRELVQRVLADFAVTPVDGLRLLEAAAVADAIERYRALDRGALTPADAAAADRAELGWRTLFARHLDALGVSR